VLPVRRGSRILQAARGRRMARIGAHALRLTETTGSASVGLELASSIDRRPGRMLLRRAAATRPEADEARAAVSLILSPKPPRRLVPFGRGGDLAGDRTYRAVAHASWNAPSGRFAGRRPRPAADRPSGLDARRRPPGDSKARGERRHAKTQRRPVPDGSRRVRPRQHRSSVVQFPAS
jgi:hypothetical protein